MKYPVLILAVMVAAACRQDAPPPAPAADAASVPFEKYVLDNGLEVILHEDHSDPIVAMATLVHVGSNREKPGKTGFAHFFEHMSFNDSENVPRGANRKMIEEWGGTRNGGTWTDGTIYYEVVPSDALEKLMWIDSDRLGYMINTVTEEALEKEKQVVKNEKRQRVDNRPYGHTGTVIAETLYPAGHPYSWPVIGSLEDLQRATLADVKAFYKDYYGPNNATLVVAGDFDPVAVKAMIQKWFGEIPRGPEPEKLVPVPVTLTETRKVYHEDNFARVPELRITYPTVEMFHPDSYALNALAQILSEGKRAPLYRVVVADKALAPEVQAEARHNELAGTFDLAVRARKGVALDDVQAAVRDAFADFEANSFADRDLERIKALMETAFYDEISGVLSKAFGLARYNVYAGDPGFVTQDIARIRQVTRADIERVYRRYIKDRPAVVTSFVPKGAPELAVTGSTAAKVYEEPIVKGAEDVPEADQAAYEKTPSSFDRSMPADGPAPAIKGPAVWAAETDGGMRVLGVVQDELPVVSFSLTVKGGHFLDPLDKSGTAELNAALLNEGTAQKAPQDFSDAVGLLGSTLRVRADGEATILDGRCLARHFNETVALAAEMLLQPRFDDAEFARLKAAAVNRARQDEANPGEVSRRVFRHLIYGDGHILGLPGGGTETSLNAITLDDLKTFYRTWFSPRLAAFHVAGAVDQAAVLKALAPFNAAWPADQVQFPAYPPPARPAQRTLYFVDIPGSKQSVLMAGLPGMGEGDEAWYLTLAAQDRLGSGSSSRLTQLLRIEKGYTYGAYSTVARNNLGYLFVATTSVRANVTFESMQLLADQLRRYGETFDEQDLATTKHVMARRNAFQYETLSGLLGHLEDISAYDLPVDTVARRGRRLQALTLAETRGIIAGQLSEKHMIYLVVGDGATQLEEVRRLGFGEPVLLDRTGRPVEAASVD